MTPWEANLRANLIGTAEILRFLGGRAFRDECVYFGIRKSADVRGGFQHVEHGVEPIQEFERLRHVAGAEFSRVHGGVGIADVFEDGCQRLGGVEIVVERRIESRGRGRGALGELEFVPAGNLSVSRRSL